MKVAVFLPKKKQKPKKISAIFVLTFKNEAYSVNIFILANVFNDSTKVAALLAYAAVSNDSSKVGSAHYTNSARVPTYVRYAVRRLPST